MHLFYYFSLDLVTIIKIMSTLSYFKSLKSSYVTTILLRTTCEKLLY